MKPPKTKSTKGRNKVRRPRKSKLQTAAIEVVDKLLAMSDKEFRQWWKEQK